MHGMMIRFDLGWRDDVSELPWVHGMGVVF